MTRGGFFKTSGTYSSPNHSLDEWPAIFEGRDQNGVRVDGLTPGVNHNARRQHVVMHGAEYNRREE
jgi:hypothetical protein